jgi:hypothetical protein
MRQEQQDLQLQKGLAASRSDGSTYKFEAVSLTLKKGKATVTAAAEDEKPPLTDVWEVRIATITSLIELGDIWYVMNCISVCRQGERTTLWKGVTSG